MKLERILFRNPPRALTQPETQNRVRRMTPHVKWQEWTKSELRAFQAESLPEPWRNMKDKSLPDTWLRMSNELNQQKNGFIVILEIDVHSKSNPFRSLDPTWKTKPFQRHDSTVRRTEWNHRFILIFEIDVHFNANPLQSLDSAWKTKLIQMYDSACQMDWIENKYLS